MLKIEKIIAEARTISETDLREPDEVSKEGDHAVGAISDPDLQRIFQLRCTRIDEFNRAVDQLSELERRSPNPTMEALRNEIDLMSKVFWTEVRAMFPELEGKEIIAVRQSWGVVWIDPSPADVIIGMLVDGHF